MNNFNFNLFKNFYYIVVYKGVTNASKNLNVAQPSLSLSIKNLELQLNKVLINRSTKQFQLTQEGLRLFETLQPMFESLEKNMECFNDQKCYTELNIGIRYCYAKSILLKFIQEFKNKYNNVKLNVDLYSKLSIDKVTNKEYDIVIDEEGYIHKLNDVSTELLCELNNYFVCGNELFSLYQNINSIKQLDDVPFISYRPSLKSGKIKKMCFLNDISFMDVININESNLYFCLLENNFGIGLSNELLLKEYLEHDSLQIIDVQEEIFSDKVLIAYTKTNQIVIDFINLLKKFVDEELQ